MSHDLLIYPINLGTHAGLDMAAATILLVTKGRSGNVKEKIVPSGNKRLTSVLKKKIVDNGSHILSEECPLARGRRVLFSRGSYSVGPL